MGQPAQDIANSALDNVGCKISQSEMWGALHRVAEAQERYPTGDELKPILLQEGEKRGLKGAAFTHYVDAFVANYAVTITGIRESLQPHDVESWKKALAEMEVGVRITDVHASLQDKINNSLQELDKAEAAMGVACAQPETDTTTPPTKFENGTVWEQLARANKPEILGSTKVLATAYQSCDVLSLPVMNNTTANVQGIRTVGRHPAGGYLREISSLATVVATHYYINGQRLAAPTCFEVRNSPPIYDFGGKPYTSSTQPLVLNLFRNGGSGTSVLGVDCSAFVFSSLAVAGLKMDPDPKKPLKADLVHGIGSRAFKEPQSNGLRCLEKISVSANQSILSGDIVAINGHVVMLENVGTDPFGLQKITSASDCTSTKILADNFDFTIAQSSPSKGGLGINRFQAKYYVKESSTYKDGFVRYAVAACKAKFGLSATINSPDLSIVRHKKTDECRAPALELERGNCVSSCRALNLAGRPL